MITAPNIILVCWIVFICYWAISAFNVKQDAQTRNRWLGWTLRILVWFLIIAGAEDILHQTHAWGWLVATPQNIWLNAVGIIFCIAGTVFAIWARWHLGRNWSSIPSRKINHELVTSGPYRWIPHPIYTGILLAILGSAMVTGLAWFILFLIFLTMFIRRVFIEEAIMIREFPSTYPAYKQKTWALVPFLW